jgi:uncharacterized protein YbjT (DUF2867 family)
MNSPPEKRRILLTGATGYVGGRLVRRLEDGGYSLRCLARVPEHLDGRVDDATEVVQGDVLAPETLAAALRDVDTAFYLIHSMGDSGNFEDLEREAARNFAEAARSAGVRRIIYLSGLGRGDLSPHLSSRQEVGKVLAGTGVQTIEFRSSVLIGSGSLSFELIRALVNHLPVMITPTWVRLPTQPIAVEDVLDYLLEAIEHPMTESDVFEIGAPDVITYAELMREYARQRGLRRVLIPVPVLSPRLSSLWLGLVTPLYARIGRKLIDSIRNETVVRDTRALSVFSVRPRTVAEAIARAMRNEDADFAETHWTDALSSKGSLRGYGGQRFLSRLVDSRSADVQLGPEDAFAPVQRIGGESGWYFMNWLWNLRGFLDLLAGGVGIRRGRRHPVALRVGDRLDWWRVEKIEPGRLLRLVAEMRVPGRAWLQFEVEALPDGGSRIHQTALFDPLGLPGLLYWYSIWPIHAVVFRGMVRGLAREANRLHAERQGSDSGAAASGVR